MEGKLTHLPQCSLSQVSPEGLSLLATSLEGVRCKPVTDHILNACLQAMEEQMKEKPLSVYEFKKSTDIWHEPMVDCDRFILKGSQLKPEMPAMYQALYRLYKEGRLTYHTDIVYGRDVFWPSRDMYLAKFKVD